MHQQVHIKAIVFDWGDTIMRDFDLPGPMSEWGKVAWVEGAEIALQALNKKYTCIIATSANHSDTSQMKAALARVGADKHFQLFYAQKELEFRKPDVRFFKAVLKKSGFKASETAMVGNLYDKDIEGAKKAGMTTFFFNEGELNGSFPAADFQVNKMEQLLQYL